MTQSTELFTKYDENFCFSEKVGAADVAAYKLYKRGSDKLLTLAGANYSGPLFYPLTLEKVGYNVTCALVGFCSVPVVASGTIAKDDPLSAGASGAVKTADANDRIIGRAYAAAADGEVVMMLPPAGEAVGAALGGMIVEVGTATLVGGTVTVTTANVLTGDVILFSRKTTGGTAGHLSLGTLTSGVSFVIQSASGTETSTVNYAILRAA